MWDDILGPQPVIQKISPSTQMDVQTLACPPVFPGKKSIQKDSENRGEMQTTPIQSLGGCGAKMNVIKQKCSFDWIPVEKESTYEIS